ncbi:hypothetical protein VCR12J2_1380349 [Vibrio coralliirubri]|nr:hypothetical protein VCR12J2_1380349 [Vibrio coralliirubri]
MTCHLIEYVAQNEFWGEYTVNTLHNYSARNKIMRFSNVTVNAISALSQ